jgi:hypothetical protein
MYIFKVLDFHDIHFSSLSLENNFYIKDLLFESNNIGCWIYNINGLNFYVPNYGFIVLFDSKFTDHKIPATLLTSKIITDKYKINSKKIYLNKNSPNYNHISLHDQMKELLSLNNLNHTFKLAGGIPPSLNIISKIESEIIESEMNNYKLGLSLFIKCFPMFLNNKIGKPLTKLEIDKISLKKQNIQNVSNFMLVPYLHTSNEYIWAIIIKKDGKDIYGITTDINNIVPLKPARIKYYYDKIIPDQTVKGLKFDENYIFEKYYI